MFNLFCLFCAEILAVAAPKATCLGCHAEYELALDPGGCITGVKITKCGSECICR